MPISVRQPSVKWEKWLVRILNTAVVFFHLFVALPCPELGFVTPKFLEAFCFSSRVGAFAIASYSFAGGNILAVYREVSVNELRRHWFPIAINEIAPFSAMYVTPYLILG